MIVQLKKTLQRDLMIFMINLDEMLRTTVSAPSIPKLNWSMLLYKTTQIDINFIICQLDDKSRPRITILAIKQ